MNKILSLLVIIAMAVVGMAGAVNLSTGPKEMVKLGGCTPQDLIQGDPLSALKSFDADVTLEGWGKNNSVEVFSEAKVMDSATDEQSVIYWTDKYFEGSMESATDLDHTWDQPASMPYDGRGRPVDSNTVKVNSGIKHQIS